MVSSGSSSKYRIVFWCVKDFSRIFVCRCHSFSFSSLLLCIYFHLYPLSSSPSLLSIHRTLGQRRGSWVCSFFFFLILFYFLTLQYCIGFAIYQNESATGWCHSLKSIIRGGRVPQGLLTWGLPNPMLIKNIKGKTPILQVRTLRFRKGT